MAIMVLSMHDREPWISEALRRGVTGYVTKGAASDELVAITRAPASLAICTAARETPPPMPQTRTVSPGRSCALVINLRQAV